MTNPFDKYLTKEQVEHSTLCNWLRLQYPKLLWWHTPNESRKTPFERYLVSMMGVKKGVSDFIIIEKRGGFNGLVIELKAKDVKVFKKDMSCYYPEQQEFLKRMSENNFYSCFCSGFEDAKTVIDNYMNLK